MSATITRRTPSRAAKVFLCLMCLTTGFVSISEAQDKGAPPWGEFLRRFEKDRLLKEPFHMAEETTPKGLASKIRARELDVPNRIKAIDYLASLDCSQFPEAKEMLIVAMQEDQFERVRFAAAKGLRDMLERNGCNSGRGRNNTCQDCQQSQGVWASCVGFYTSTVDTVKHKMKNRERQEARAEDCRCKNCCDEDTLNALAKTAYEMDEKGCPVEPSTRVREMAVEAISVCGIECHYRPYYVSTEVSPMPAVEEEPTVDPEAVRPLDPENIPAPELEEVPEVDAEEVPAIDRTPMDDDMEDVPELPQEAQLPPLPELTETPAPAVEKTAELVAPSPISHLEKICIVSWRDGVRVTPDPSQEAVYKGRIYHFANEECLNKFQADPEKYAVAFGGCDPVHFVKTHEVKVGRYLVDCGGRFYMFSTIENLEEFNAQPESYSLKQDRVVQVSGNE
ncbi:YHS domain protein [Thalassoglobus neptunius]|uniref:YHS domain protein n=1 Tax=Thalassoglobus neptunius TaxID=1938619 RepID=A0A5C5WJC3_9PLAN|nr:YHS domain-containing protein [Thalassoglobus neptunius]TWT50083.1 YHS domain protein [Thalassoglobus neptunius]